MEDDQGISGGGAKGEQGRNRESGCPGVALQASSVNQHVRILLQVVRVTILSDC